MSRKTDRAAAFAVVAMLFTALAGAATTGASAQADTSKTVEGQTNGILESTAAQLQDESSTPKFVSEPVVQALPESYDEPAELDAAVVMAPEVDSLGELVEHMGPETPLSKDLRCLAGAIYFESRGEPLPGQLAVGQVIVNRAQSSRFPDTYCGVVLQRSQFSFVRGGSIPAIQTGSVAWERAKAIALIAHEGLWDSPAADALFFHATRINPGWRMKRVATVSRHVFYR